MPEKNFFLLLHVAQKGGLFGEFRSSTSAIARETGFSQQSVSRKLRELAAMKLITVSSSPFGVHAKITAEGKRVLLEKHRQLNELFSPAQKKKMSGMVQSGLGEGKYYLSFKQYSDQVKEKLGFSPFIGTLNIKADEHELENFRANLAEIYLDGFNTAERSFGGLKAYSVKINSKVNGAMIFPDRSHLPGDTAEIIAPLQLRKKFSLKDGDKIIIEAKK
jgi:riboflavin kinase